ncbi:PCNA-interacting partner [Trichonephila clavata]|uniref:PCNA-interacting partner n=1 Tax=Trichonephila clavata TaxID=2740835 RepID=A0A8X6F588_TRICU|nr:PCNA-interacting partner [Trichonephila clavata]
MIVKCPRYRYKKCASPGHQLLLPIGFTYLRIPIDKTFCIQLLFIFSFELIMSKPKVWLWKEPDSRLKENVLGLIKDVGFVETDTVLLHCIDVEGFDESIPLTKFILNLCESFNVFKNERTMFLNLKDLLQAIELCLGRLVCKSECSELKISEEEIMQCLQTYIEQFKSKEETSLENNVLNMNTFIEENNFADLWLINNKLSEQKINNSNYMDQLTHSNYLILGTLPSEIFQNIIRLLTIEGRVLNVVVETPLNSSLQGSPSSTPTIASSNIEVTSEIIEITDISLVPEREMKLGSATEEFIEETILSFLSLLVNSRNELALSKAMISPIIDLSHKAFTELRHLSEKKEMPMCQTAISYVTKIKLGGKGYAPPPDCPMLPHFKKLELFVDTLNQMQTLIEEDLTPISAVKRLINVLKKKLLKCGSDNLRTSAIETVAENLQNIAIKVLDLQLEFLPRSFSMFVLRVHFNSESTCSIYKGGAAVALRRWEFVTLSHLWIRRCRRIQNSSHKSKNKCPEKD